MKTSRDYWNKRFDLLEESLLGVGDNYAQELNYQYQVAMKKMEDDLLSWYARIANNNEISLGEAKRKLNAKELAEFRWDLKEYIRRGKENAIDGRWLKELENASARVHIERLQVMKMKMQHQVEMLTASKLNGLTDAGRKIYEESYYGTIYEVQKGLGFGHSFQQLNTDGIKKAISRPWAPDGKNFSQRIWEDREKLLNTLQAELTQSLMLGKSSLETAKVISQKMNVSRSNALRLVLTESSFFANAGHLASYKELELEEGEVIATLDTKTSEICQHMDGKVMPMSEAKIGVTIPPFHVRCRSTFAPYFEGNVTERVARGEDGKTYTVPGDMKYKEWKEKYVNEGKGEAGVETSEKKIVKNNDLCQKYGESHYNEVIKRVDAAPGHIRQVWNKYEDRFQVLEVETQGGAFYRRGSGIVLNVEKDSVGKNGRRPFSATFHELGHHIDDLAGRDKNGNLPLMFSSTYGNGIFQRTITKDINDYIDDIHKQLKKEFAAQGKYYSKAYAYKYFEAELKGLSEFAKPDISDIVEGVTKCKVQAGWGHGSAYWKRSSDRVGVEAFAEFFDATMNNPDSRRALEKYLPNAVKVFDEMMEEILKE